MVQELKLLLIFIFWGSLCFLGSCTWNQTAIQQQTILKIESHEMTSKQFADELARRLSKYDALTAKDPKVVSQTKETITNDFIMSAILQLWAAKNNVSITKEHLEAEIKNVRTGFPDDFSFREELSKQGLSINQWQKTVEIHLIEKSVMENLQKEVPEPSEESIKKYYENNRSKYKQQDKIYLQQIVLAEKSDAVKIQAALKSGKSFEFLAKQFSVTPEAKQGGLVGWIEKGTLEVFDKAFSFPIGTPSEIIQSPYGFHIMLVLKKMSAGISPLNTVHDSIKRELKAQAEQSHFKSWLEQQVRSSHVFKDQQLIDKMAVETRKE